MPRQHIEGLEKKITALSDALAKLGGRETTLADIIKIIHHPGWTTPAELAFASAMVNAIQVHISAIEGLQADLMSACQKVGEQTRSAATAS